QLVGVGAQLTPQLLLLFAVADVHQSSNLQAQRLENARAHPGGEAAVDDERMPGHERRVLGRQERGRRRDLFRTAEPAEHVRLPVPLAYLLHAFERHDRLEHRRLDEAGADAVGAHADATVVDRQVLGEEEDRGLRGVVRDAALRAFDALDARDVYEGPRILIGAVRDRT